MLQRLPRAQLYAVDPFLSGYDPSDRHAHAMAAIASKLGLNKTELSVAWASGMAYDLTARHGSCRLHCRPTPLATVPCGPLRPPSGEVSRNCVQEVRRKCLGSAAWPAPTAERQKAART